MKPILAALLLVGGCIPSDPFPLPAAPDWHGRFEAERSENCCVRPDLEVELPTGGLYVDEYAPESRSEKELRPLWRFGKSL